MIALVYEKVLIDEFDEEAIKNFKSSSAVEEKDEMPVTNRVPLCGFVKIARNLKDKV